ncbi:nucleoside-diphosphate sugar epimerase/dehydratase [Brevundimonas kwangchunensis]|uniref:Nucleoside-diphosphate sugar epimerase/dehydratase n=1 Tax=Brevundimonas kwangchunensis TaxID=322163 RepID=A0ABN1GGP5_9CAUL
MKIYKILTRAAVRFAAVVIAYSLATHRDINLESLIDSVSQSGLYALFFVGLGAIYDVVMRLDRAPWRYASIQNVLTNLRTSTLTVLLFLIVAFVIDRADTLPRSMFALTWMLDVVFFSGALLIRRAMHEQAFGRAFAPFLGKGDDQNQEDLIIIGELDSAEAFLRDRARGQLRQYRPLGLITSDKGDEGRELHGVQVLASFPSAGKALDDYSRQESKRAILFADDSIAPADIDPEVLGRLRASGVRMLRHSVVADLNESGPKTSLRELDLEDLLSRPPVALDFGEIRKMISGRRVLVTGAGGSIGSEICRQVAALGCAHLSLLDNSEFGLFKISIEVSDRFPTMSRNDIICDIRDADRIRHWVAQEQPDIIFHAAALKHVPLMEHHPCESVLTNVVGTSNVAAAALVNHVDQMVFISTDKAVDPGNVMGATKRLAESVVRRHRTLGGATSFSVVRFGNVLGSAGSVVPTFLDQIRRGGPVTVTHAEVERYFMTIPEAVQLVLHATASVSMRASDQSGLFVLDMGPPVKIMDLARRLIGLSDMPEARKIEIRITGLRPGEKLTEELVDSTEVAVRCDQGVFEVSDRGDTGVIGDTELALLKEQAQLGDSAATKVLLFRMLDQVRNGASDHGATS